MSKGAKLIEQERLRQIQQEGWTAGHDDRHDNGELIEAAGAYLQGATKAYVFCPVPYVRSRWPFEAKSSPECKQHDHWKNLVIAGAFITAELDRLDRAGKLPKIDELRTQVQFKPGDRVQLKEDHKSTPGSLWDGALDFLVAGAKATVAEPELVGAVTVDTATDNTPTIAVEFDDDPEDGQFHFSASKFSPIDSASSAPEDCDPLVQPGQYWKKTSTQPFTSSWPDAVCIVVPDCPCHEIINVVITRPSKDIGKRYYFQKDDLLKSYELQG